MVSRTRDVVGVVDDDSRVLESVCNLLQSAGYEVRSFNSAEALLDDQEALATINCLICDVGLPGINGFTLQRQLAEKIPRLPVILMTGRYDQNDPRAASPNNRGLIRKPSHGDELLDALGSAIRGDYPES